MSRGPESSEARVNWQSSFTDSPLAFSMDVGPVDVICSPQAEPEKNKKDDAF